MFDIQIQIDRYLLLLSIILFVGISTPHTTYGQKLVDKVFQNTKVREVDTYEFDKAFYGQIMLQIPFGERKIANQSDILLIKNLNIKKIELVYTAYPETSYQNTGQVSLNKKRLQSLYQQATFLFENTNIKWELVAQVGIRETAKAKNLFHGFIVYYDAEDIRREQNNKKQQTSTETEKPRKTPEIEEKKFDYNPLSPSAVNIKQKKITTEPIALQAFDRNFKTWGDNVVVVCDWTASMYGYGEQVLIWFLTQKADDIGFINHFVFFNDGDSTPDNQKIIGKTGGIYATEEGTIEEALLLMEQCRAGGQGGDFPENDLEALLFAQEKYPDADALVLIADNMATVRDIALLEKLNKKVHIIPARLKGGTLHILMNYIDIAIHTKGSLHTKEQDIYQLEELKALKAEKEQEINMSKKERKKIIKKQERKIRKTKRRNR
ncbi:MAG: hypothetical protein JJT94_05615 [Bernardetiaceae bacterium]|nr:hypothetical protein [Bernardetiaceae bacterium]